MKRQSKLEISCGFVGVYYRVYEGPEVGVDGYVQWIAATRRLVRKTEKVDLTLTPWLADWLADYQTVLNEELEGSANDPNI